MNAIAKIQQRIQQWKHWPRVSDRAYQYYLLTRLNKPIGIYLLLWPALWALWMAAKGFPDIGVLLVFILGVVLMRSAGCVINDYADRKIDPHVARTHDRPIAAGKVSPAEALKLFSAMVVFAFLLVLTMNTYTVLLSFGGAALAAIYPFMKRYTYLPQVVLGAAFGWAVPMAFAAQTNAVPPVAWILFIATVLWATAYDTMYAMVDRDDDLKIGVKSTAILFGDMDRIIIAIIQVLMMLALLMAGKQMEMGAWYYAGLTVAAGFAGYHQFLIRDREREACFRAFLNNHWLGMSIFIGILLDYLFRS
jgi:4-hydroxybenzoate polyprenyltransferase